MTLVRGPDPTLLIVEDDGGFREALALEFEDRGYRVTVAASTSGIEGGPWRFAIVDLRLGAENGLAAIERIRTLSRECRVVVVTGYGSIATAVKAVKLGAVNYLAKPVTVEALERALWIDGPMEPEGNDLASPPPTLARHEREYIEYVLARCDGNVTRAAAWLGLHRQSLQRKLRKFSPHR